MFLDDHFVKRTC